MGSPKASRRLVSGAAVAAIFALCALTGPSLALAQGLGDGDSGADQGGPASANLPRAGSSIDSGPQPGDNQPQGGGGGGDDAAKTAPPPPPALPGSHAQATNVAPADRVTADMNPTAALFDAINRGDTDAARDAVGRGADLDGHNVLGLTPIELSVDLGRNDISFLLLSLHTGGDDSDAAMKAVDASASSAPRRGRHAGHALAPAPVSAVAGAPLPDTGFLGFGKGGT